MQWGIRFQALSSDLRNADLQVDERVAARQVSNLAEMLIVKRVMTTATGYDNTSSHDIDVGECGL